MISLVGQQISRIFPLFETWSKFPRNYTDNFPRSMKGIGRGTIQRCDARPLTAPFLLMFHNYYHAINSNGTGGRPLRKRHSSARIINIYVSNRRSAAENSLFIYTSFFFPPFSFLSFFLFFFRIQRKRFPRSLANCPLFSPPPFRTHFSLFTRDYAGTRFQSRPDSRFRSLRRKSLAIQQPPFFSCADLNFYSRFSIQGVKVKRREERIRSNV